MRRGSYKPCMIYFLRCGADGAVKVGATKRHVRNRIAELQPYSPFELRLIGAYRGYYKDEAEFKKRWRPHRLYGEWFEPVPFILEEIQAYPIPNDLDLDPREFARQFAPKVLARNSDILRDHKSTPTLSHEALARRHGCSPGFVSRLVRDVADPGTGVV